LKKSADWQIWEFVNQQIKKQEVEEEAYEKEK